MQLLHRYKSQWCAPPWIYALIWAYHRSGLPPLSVCVSVHAGRLHTLYQTQYAVIQYHFKPATRKAAAQATATRAAAPPEHERQPRPKRRPRAPQLLQKAVCSAPATRTRRRPRAPQLLQEALCSAPATRTAAAAQAAAKAAAAQEAATRAAAPPEVSVPATRKAAAAQAAATRAAAPPGCSVYCACHTKGRGPSGGWGVWDEWWWDVWDEWCVMRGVGWVVCDKKWGEWWWDVWDEWCVMRGVRWVVCDEKWSEWCEMSGDERCEMSGVWWGVERDDGEAARSKRKTKTPHNNIGNNTILFIDTNLKYIIFI